MTCTCPICKRNSTKHNLYGVKLKVDCPLCLSSDTFDENDENGIIIIDEDLKLETLECGHVFHKGCLKNLINHASIDDDINTEPEPESDIMEFFLPRYRLPPMPIFPPPPPPPPTTVRNSYPIWINEADTNVPFWYCNKICEWSLGLSGDIILYETRMNDPFQGGSYWHRPPHPFNTSPRWFWINQRNNYGKWILLQSRRYY